MQGWGTGLGNINGLHKTSGIVGPWQCSKCGQLSQFCDITRMVNRIFCKNEACDYYRIIDKVHMRIVEDDGSHWKFDFEGNKTRIGGQ